MLTEPVRVCGSNLPVNSTVTLKTSLVSAVNKFNFEAVNIYQTSEDGKFNTVSHPTLAGSMYTGVHPSGPVWSIRPKAGSKQRLWSKDICSKLHYNFKLFNSNNQLIGEDEMTKVFLSPDVARIGIRQGKVRGAVFMPAKKIRKGKTKAVIVMFGGAIAGRAPEDTAALMAAEGFITMALAFYGAEGQPIMYHDIDIEEMEEAVDYLRSMPEVEDKRINLFGVSKGGDICAAMAAFLGDKIGGTVAVNNPFASIPGTTVYKDQVIRGTQFRLTGEPKELFRYNISTEEFHGDYTRQVPVERCRGPILAIVGLDDTFSTRSWAWNSQKRSFRFGKEDLQIVKYPGLGHLLDPPNFPVCLQGPNPFVPTGIEYGGEIQLHSLAQIDAWNRIISFYEDV